MNMNNNTLKNSVSYVLHYARAVSSADEHTPSQQMPAEAGCVKSVHAKIGVQPPLLTATVTEQQIRHPLYDAYLPVL